MTSFVSFDGVDETSLGLELREVPGVWDAAPMAWPIVAIPNAPGGMFGAIDPTIPPIVKRFTGLIKQTTAALAEDAVQTLRDAITLRLVGIRYAHAPTRSWFGVCTDPRGGHYSPLALPGWVSVDISFLCHYPYATDDDILTYSGITDEKVSIPIGTGQTAPDIYLIGGSNHVVKIRDQGGNLLATITLAITGKDWVLIRTIDGGDVFSSVSGVVSNSLSAVAAGSRFPVFSPRDGNRASLSYPTVETNSGTIVVESARGWS